MRITVSLEYQIDFFGDFAEEAIQLYAEDLVNAVEHVQAHLPEGATVCVRNGEELLKKIEIN